MKKMVNMGDFVGLNLSSRALICSHQQFLDDSIVMGEALVRNARNIKRALEDYEKALGQFINWDKSLIYFINVNVSRKNKIKNIMGCEIGSLPSSYLGLPLGLNPLEIFWSSLIKKIQLKLVGWKGSLLSQAGRLLY